MVVKDRRGRRRYIAFRVVSDSPVSAQVMTTMLNDTSDDLGIRAPRLIDFDGTLGIVRCSNLEKEGILRMLADIDSTAYKCIRIESLRTSGTLKTLREKYRPHVRGGGEGSHPR
jgi:RNase P/RNase MRP subunit POP5